MTAKTAGMIGMYKAKRIACAVMAGVTVLSATGISAYAKTFSDISGHWAQSVIEKWSDKGVIEGYNGEFNPDAGIIRGDMAVILNRIGEYSEKSENTFGDLDDNAYYAEAVLKLNKAGIMLGSEGSVRPSDRNTREEAFVMLDRVYNFTGTSQTTGFEDESDISEWAKKAILAMCENKIINGSDGRINPKLNITRAEIIQLLDNITAYLERIFGKNDGDNGGDVEIDKDSGSSGGITIGGGSGSGSSGGGGSSSGGSSGGSGSSSSSGSESSGGEASIGGNDIDVGGIW